MDFRTNLSHALERYRAEIADSREHLALLRWQMAEGHALDRRDTFPGHLTTSAFVLSPDHTQVLLIDHVVIGRWLQPGGHDVPGKPSRGEPAHIHHDLQYLFLADPALPLVAQVEEVHAAAWKPIGALAEIAPRALERLSHLPTP